MSSNTKPKPNKTEFIMTNIMKLIYTFFLRERERGNVEKSKFDRESYSMRNEREPAFMNLPSYTWPLYLCHESQD